MHYPSAYYTSKLSFRQQRRIAAFENVSGVVRTLPQAGDPSLPDRERDAGQRF